MLGPESPSLLPERVSRHHVVKARAGRSEKFRFHPPGCVLKIGQQYLACCDSGGSAVDLSLLWLHLVICRFFSLSVF